jgi:hypothetical protein
MRNKFPRLRLLICFVAAMGVSALAGLTPADQPSAHNNALSNCYPRYWNMWPPDNQVAHMNQSTAPKCANVPAGQYSQQSGWEYVTWGDPDGWAWYYMQHNPDEYVQEQLSGPSCSYSGTSPHCYTSPCSGGWQWWGYWQQNPNGWKQQQVNTCSGGPYWFRSGYF